MFKRSIPATVLASVLLSACQSNLYTNLEPDEVTTRNAAPPGAEPGTCWDQDATPAVIEVVTEQVLVQPAETHSDGQLAEPAVYKTETHQKIVKPRQDTWFETPCAADITPEFTASVQRALKARGHYRGPITGRLDGRTRAAIRAYQKPQGLDSGTLSLAAARQMGLVSVETPGQPAVRAPEITPVFTTPLASAPAPSQPAQQDTTLTIPAKADPDDTARQQAEEEARIARENAEREERIARAEAAAKAAEEARLREAAQQAAAEKAKRARELEQALAEEKARNERGLKTLPLSTETY